MDIKKTWKSLTRNTYLSDFFLVALFLVILALFRNGLDALKLICAGLISAAVLELLVNGIAARFLLKRKPRCDYPLAAYMGICTALMLPAQAPVWFPIVGLLIAYIITGLIIPLASSSVMIAPRFQLMTAATAITALTILFKNIMFTFIAEPADGEVLAGATTAFGSIGKLLTDGLAGGKTPYKFWDFFTGSITGPIGTTCFILIIAALVYLSLRRPAFLLAPLSFIATVCVWALIFPRGEAGRLQSVGLELCAGSLLFAAVFLLGIPKYLPKKPLHRLIYGAACALLTMIFRRMGLYEETVCIAILLMNFTLPVFNKNRGSSGGKKISAKNEHLLGDVPDFMKKDRSQDDILDDFAD